MSGIVLTPMRQFASIGSTLFLSQADAHRSCEGFGEEASHLGNQLDRGKGLGDETSRLGEPWMHLKPALGNRAEHQNRHPVVWTQSIDIPQHLRRCRGERPGIDNDERWSVGANLPQSLVPSPSLDHNVSTVAQEFSEGTASHIIGVDDQNKS
jgi:hypothetical protein